jgi:hypothetical protein
MKTLVMVKAALEYLGGVTDEPPSGFKLKLDSLWWGVWWGLLAMGIVLFCGQSSKFIYIDF